MAVHLEKHVPPSKHFDVIEDRCVNDVIWNL